jgi:hypothetical protein
MEKPQLQKGFRNLINPGAGFGAFIVALGDALVKAINRSLGYAVNYQDSNKLREQNYDSNVYLRQ